MVMLKPKFPWKSTFEKLISMENLSLLESYIFWPLHRNYKSMLKYSNIYSTKPRRKAKNVYLAFCIPFKTTFPIFFIKFGTKINSISTLVLLLTVWKASQWEKRFSKKWVESLFFWTLKRTLTIQTYKVRLLLI